MVEGMGNGIGKGKGITSIVFLMHDDGALALPADAH
jgi:hypothetical protein